MGSRREHHPLVVGRGAGARVHLEGLQITGKAYRVPIRTGSIAELNLLTERPVTVEQVNDAFRKAAGVRPSRASWPCWKTNGRPLASSATRTRRSSTCR